jgi:hypothetical protein
MAIFQYLKSVKNFLRHDLSLEPVIFGYLFTWFVVEGSQMTTNILITKICRIELKYPEDFCNKMTSKENITKTDETLQWEAEVQRRVNDFEVMFQLLFLLIELSPLYYNSSIV